MPGEIGCDQAISATTRFGPGRGALGRMLKFHGDGKVPAIPRTLGICAVTTGVRTLKESGVDYLVVHESREGGATLLAAHGELDAFSGVHLADRLAQLAAAGRHRLIFDAAGLTFCDTHGIRILINGHLRARDQGGWLRLARADWRIRKLLSILPALETPGIFASVTDALAEIPIEARGADQTDHLR